MSVSMATVLLEYLDSTILLARHKVAVSLACKRLKLN